MTARERKLRAMAARAGKRFGAVVGRASELAKVTKRQVQRVVRGEQDSPRVYESVVSAIKEVRNDA